MKKSNQSGFTIMELMIAVTIVGILSMIAMPSYKSYLGRANRAVAIQMVSLIANKEAQYFQDARGYTGAVDSTGLNIGNPDGWSCAGNGCSNKNHTVSVTVDNTALPPTFMVTAAPVAGGTNASDANLTLNQSGTKTGPWNN